MQAGSKERSKPCKLKWHAANANKWYANNVAIICKQAANKASSKPYNKGKDMQIANAIKRYAKNETSVQLGNNAYNKNMQ